MKKAEGKLVGVNTATSQYSKEAEKEEKNGKSKQKLSDVVDKLFKVQREVPDLEKEF